MKHLIAPSFSGGRNGWLVPLFSSHESPSVILFNVPSGPGQAFFRNGSLACNIIRNTLGYHLIFLQCDHMRKCVLMWGAQVRLVTLCLGGCCVLSLFPLTTDGHVTADLTACSTSSRCVSKT